MCVFCVCVLCVLCPLVRPPIAHQQAGLKGRRAGAQAADASQAPSMFFYMFSNIILIFFIVYIKKNLPGIFLFFFLTVFLNFIYLATII